MTHVSTNCDDRARQVALAVQKATGINRILLFGSRARGDYDAESDIDLLVVHPEDPDVENLCAQIAQEAVQGLYQNDISTDLILISPALFAKAQFGLNHVAAQAVKDGVTPMGEPYRPKSGEEPPRYRFRIEAMERSFHASGHFANLQRYMRPGESDYFGSQAQFSMFVGKDAQGALEHALKALIASSGQKYERIHDLVKLAQQAKQAIPDFQGLESPLSHLSAFAGAGVYRTPSLAQDVGELFAMAQADINHIFALVQEQGDFDPWSVKESDFRF